MLPAVLHSLLALLYPPRCAVCSTLGIEAPLCDTCTAALVPLPEPWCRRCGHTMTPERACDNCRLHPLAFDSARAFGTYSGTLRSAVHCFKYRNRPSLAEPLGTLLAAHARAHSDALHALAFDGVLPVPMHPARQRRRGYNQSERLARVVARELGLTLDARLLARARRTRAQVGLSAQQRRGNLGGAFRVCRPTDARGKTFLLVDDVMTTGASLSECAAMLKLAGARGVCALVLATS